MGLRTMREEAGLSQQELRRKMGLNAVGRVWSWEAWDSTPRPKTAMNPMNMTLDSACKMADALGMTLDELREGLDDERGER